MNLNSLHKSNAKILGIFIALHLANHLALLISRQAHLDLIETLRLIYRPWFIEYPLLFLFAAQIVLGVLLITKRGKPSNGWAWAQVLSGGYIAFFLLQHVSAALMARVLHDFETTTFWAASVVSKTPFVYYFFPYYVLAIFAMFTHIAAAMRFSTYPRAATRFQKSLPVVGFILGVAIVTSLSRGSAAEMPLALQDYLRSFYAG